MCLSLAVEGRELAGEAWGAAWHIGVCYHKLWLWFLSQQWWTHWRLPAALRRMLPGASSSSYQVGSCQGARPLFPLLVSLLFPRRLLVLCPCALQDTQLWLLSAAPLFWCPSQHRRGQGSARWLSGCLGCTLLRSHAGHHQAGCLLASRRRSGFAPLPDWGLWQAHGSLLLWERRPGLALPHPPRCWACQAGLLEAHPGLAGLPKQLADHLQSLSCLSLTEADPSPRKNRGAGSALSAKRKIPGESLINPGFKR